MIYKDQQVEVLSMSGDYAVIRCDGVLKCVGVAQLKEDEPKKKKAKAGQVKNPPVDAKK